MKSTLSTKEKFQQVSRDLDDELGLLWIQLQALEGAKEFLYDISNELDTAVHRGYASHRERKLSLKINAIYELMNHSLYETNGYEKEISKLSNEVFHHFAKADKNTTIQEEQ